MKCDILKDALLYTNQYMTNSSTSTYAVKSYQL